jgi:hypothetical protein
LSQKKKEEKRKTKKHRSIYPHFKTPPLNTSHTNTKRGRIEEEKEERHHHVGRTPVRAASHAQGTPPTRSSFFSFSLSLSLSLFEPARRRVVFIVVVVFIIIIIIIFVCVLLVQSQRRLDDDDVDEMSFARC